LAFTAAIVSSAFFPERMTMMPPATSPSPFSSAIPRRIPGPTWTAPRRPAHRHAAGAVLSGTAEVVERLPGSRSADHVFGLAQFEHRAAGFLVRLLHGLDDLACVMP
jgi:hypothetical protein